MPFPDEEIPATNSGTEPAIRRRALWRPTRGAGEIPGGARQAADRGDQIDTGIAVGALGLVSVF